jgi:hypothetical protein
MSIIVTSVGIYTTTSYINEFVAVLKYQLVDDLTLYIPATGIFPLQPHQQRAVTKWQNGESVEILIEQHSRLFYLTKDNEEYQIVIEAHKKWTPPRINIFTWRGEIGPIAANVQLFAVTLRQFKLRESTSKQENWLSIIRKFPKTESVEGLLPSRILIIYQIISMAHNTLCFLPHKFMYFILSGNIHDITSPEIKEEAKSAFPSTQELEDALNHNMALELRKYILQQEGCQYRYTVLHTSEIYGGSAGHAILLVIDNPLRRLYIFDSNGQTAHNEPRRYSIITNILTNSELNLTIATDFDICPLVGPHGKSRYLGVGGFCISWSLLFFLLLVTNDTKNPHEIVAEVLLLDPNELLDTIQRFTYITEHMIPTPREKTIERVEQAHRYYQKQLQLHLGPQK